AWRRRSALGAVLSGIALGRKEALEREKEEPAVIVQVSGDPIGERPVEAQLDDRTPKDSVVTIRPWLLPEADLSGGAALAAPVGNMGAPVGNMGAPVGNLPAWASRSASRASSGAASSGAAASGAA